MGFGVSILLSITVYILVLSEKVPENSRERSALGTCFTCIIYILSIALSFALMTMKLVNRKEKPPKWTQRRKNRLQRRMESYFEIFR